MMNQVDLTKQLNDASRRADIEGVVKLLGEGADPNGVEMYRFGRTEHYAFALNSAVCSRSYTDSRLAVIKLLLDAGADPNFQIFDSGTPLYAATYYGYHEAVLLLVQYGGDLTLRYKNNMLVLDLAKLRFERENYFIRHKYTIDLIEALTKEPFSLLTICLISIRKNRINIEKLPPVLIESSIL